MPNGFDGTHEEWLGLEAPLQSLDSALRAFGRRHGLALSRNGRGWPERSFRWESGLSRLIQVYLSDQVGGAYTLWVCASEDRAGVRYWKKRTLREGIGIQELATELPALLETALTMVRGWNAEDLEVAGSVGD
jgi:hypothetical protein